MELETKHSVSPDQVENNVAAVSEGQQPPSYHSAAKPLLVRYCASCHSDEGIEAGLSPFPLVNYSQVYGKRSALVYVLEAGTMPPQGYAGPCSAETERVGAGRNDGAPEGDISQTPVIEVLGEYTPD